MNDVAFIARIEKLYEKTKRYKDKLESGKLIDVLFDIKQEVEGYTGKKIDLESHIDQIEKEAKKGGAKFNLVFRVINSVKYYLNIKSE